MCCLSAIGAACAAVTLASRLVGFTGQSNIIVWDEVTKTEHFIRNAKFASNAKDLGFIAPTPSLPKLEEVDAKAFETLKSAIHDFEERMKEVPRGCAKNEPVKGLEILQAVNVAGYRAVTLRASDSSQLISWMKANHYVTTPSIKEWIEFYVKRSWLFTAFSVDSKSGRGETGLVKMSFKTDRPFNPYYIPVDNFPDAASKPSGLILYFVATGRFSPEPGAPDGLREHGAVAVEGNYVKDLATQLKLPSLPPNTTITTFIDEEFPRSSLKQDVFFDQSGPQPTIPFNPLTACCGTCSGFILLGIWYAVHRIRRARREEAAASEIFYDELTSALQESHK